MKCAEESCNEPRSIGWLKCARHVWEVAGEQKTMISKKCKLSFCTNESRYGHVLCLKHLNAYSDSSMDDIGEWIAFKEDKDLEAPSATPKQNEGKRRFSLVRWEFTRAIADVMTWGLAKYPAENYLSMDSTTIYDSMMRHLDAHLQGEKTDDESGKPHLWHFASNVMMWFILEFRKEK